MSGYQTHMGPTLTVEADGYLGKIWLGEHCKQHILLKPDVGQACNISHSKCNERAESSIKEDNAQAHHFLTMDSCQSRGQKKSRDAQEHFPWLKSQSWQSRQLKKSFLGGCFPSEKRSSEPDEEVIKLLQLLAGNVETNPGPKVSQCECNMHQNLNQ